LILEPLIGHAGMGGQSTRESPWSFPAQPDITGYFQGSPHSAEFPNFCSSVPPALPVAHAHSASEPTVNFRDGTVIFRNTEVIHPSSDILGELLVTILHGDEPTSAGQLLTTRTAGHPFKIQLQAKGTRHSKG